MSDETRKTRSEADAELEREIREARKFTLEEAIGRLAGPGAMKGESPVPKLKQSQAAIESWLGDHLRDHEGALKVVLNRYIKESDLLLSNLDEPFVVLAACCTRILESEFLLNELTRSADVEWGRTMGERPYFQKADFPTHPDDPYTIDSVRIAVREALDELSAGELDAARASPS